MWTFPNLRAVRLSFEISSPVFGQTPKLQHDLSPLSQLPNLEHLELMAVRGRLEIPGGECFPKLTHLTLIGSTDRFFSCSFKPDALPLRRLTIFAFSGGADLKNMLPLMPVLETLLTSCRDDSLSTFASRVVNASLALKPNLRILNFNGQTLAAVFFDTFSSELKEFCDTARKENASNSTWDINAVGLFHFQEPIFNARISELILLGWNPKSRYPRWIPRRALASKLIFNRERSFGALMRAVLELTPDKVALLIPFWSDEPIAHLIETEPVHPILAAVCYGCDPLIRHFQSVQDEWDWFDFVKMPFLRPEPRVPLIIGALILKDFRSTEALSSTFAPNTASVLLRLSAILNSPHQSYGTWFHFLASRARYSNLVLLVQLMDNLPVDLANNLGLKPLHYALELDPLSFPSTLGISLDTYTNSLEVPAAEAGLGIAAMRRLLLNPEVPLSFIEGLRELIRKKNLRLSDWMSAHDVAIHPNFLPELCTGVSEVELTEIAQYMLLSRQLKALGTGDDLRAKALITLGCLGCSWSNPTSQLLVDFLFTHWTLADFSSSPYIFDNNTLPREPVPSVRVPLETLFAVADQIRLDATLLAYIRNGYEYTEAEYLSMLHVVFGRVGRVTSSRSHDVSFSSLLLAELLDRIGAPLSSLHISELLTILSCGISVKSSLETLRKLLAAISSRWRTIGCSPLACPWAALLQLSSCSEAYAAGVCDLLISFKVTSLTLTIPVVLASSASPTALLKYMAHHSDRLCVTAACSPHLINPSRF